jgi:hypothetical protein
MTIETDRVTTLLFEVTLSPRDTVCPRGDAFPETVPYVEHGSADPGGWA